MKRASVVGSTSVLIVLLSAVGASATFPGTNGNITYYNYS